MEYALAFLVITLCGIGRRVAGGAFEQWTGINLGDLPTRLFFGACVALTAFTAGHLSHPLVINLHVLNPSWTDIVFPLWAKIVALILGVWVGTTIPNFSSIDFGKAENTVLHDFLGLIIHGLGGVALPAFIAAQMGYFWQPLILAGLFISPAYWVGWALAGKHGLNWLPVGFRGGSELGEFLWGSLCIGAATYMAFL